MGAAAAAHPSAADMAFVQLAAGTDMYEIEASRLAIGRAPDTQVKGYAQMLIDHHTMSSNQMKALLHAKGVVPPAALPPDKQAKIAQLSRLQGRDFEREYIRMTGVADHQAAIGQFEQASRSLPDADLRNFAARTLPVLQQHLRAAQEIAGRMAG
jgi:putative membrane protein